jgi:hypothetical protein
MVQRQGLPRFPYPVPSRENYLITPEGLKERWNGQARAFLLVDDVIPPASFLQKGQMVLKLPGKSVYRNRP